jgi:hypothetical protein
MAVARGTNLWYDAQKDTRGATHVQLIGTLNKFPLRELIEMIVYSSVAGVLELQIGNEIGQLFFDDGRPYHAVVGDDTGFEAVGRMFEERDAMFRFVAGPTAGTETLWLDPWEMMERAERQARLWLSVRPRFPNLSYVPSLRSNAGVQQIHINEHTWPVLSAVDGQRDIAAIAETLGLAQLDVCVALASLLDQGLISVRAPHPALLEPRSPAGQQRSQSPRSGAGFFDRLLAQAQASEEEQRPDLADENAQDQQSNRYISNRYVNNR